MLNNKRLLAIVVMLNVIGFIPGFMRAEQPKACFELAKPEYAQYLTSEEARGLVALMDSYFRGEKRVSIEEQMDAVSVLHAALINNDGKALALLSQALDNPAAGIPTLLSGVLAENIFAVIRVGVVGWWFTGLFKPAVEAQELRGAFFGALNMAQEVVDVEKRLGGDYFCRAGYVILYCSLCDALEKVIGLDAVNGAVKSISGGRLIITPPQDFSKLEPFTDEVIALVERQSDRHSIAQKLVCAGLAYFSVRATYDFCRGIYLRFHARKFINNTPDAHVILAQKLNEFCAAR